MGKLLKFALLMLLAGCALQPEAPELILVAGASGRAGHFVVQRLRADEVAFRPLTRSREEAIERLGPAFADLDWVECDVRDPAQVAAAMRGVTQVISVIGANQIGGPNSAEFVDYGGVKNLVDAAVAVGK